MAITVDGDLPAGVTAKDVVLAIIARIGTGGGIGSVLEYRGSAIRALSMEGRMTVCNMSIEAGARAGLVAPDDTTFAYLEGRPFAPKGTGVGSARSTTGAASPTDAGAAFDKEVVIDAATLRPARVVGHEPRADRSRIDDVGARPRRARPTRRRATSAQARAHVHGPEGRHADARHRRRHRVHRVVHELAHRGPAGRGRSRARPAGEGRRAHARGARVGRGEGAGRSAKGSTRCSAPRASTGASRAVRCAWR